MFALYFLVHRQQTWETKTQGAKKKKKITVGIDLEVHAKGILGSQTSRTQLLPIIQFKLKGNPSLGFNLLHFCFIFELIIISNSLPSLNVFLPQTSHNAMKLGKITVTACACNMKGPFYNRNISPSKLESYLLPLGLVVETVCSVYEELMFTGSRWELVII
jgi:hypothetical protein